MISFVCKKGESQIVVYSFTPKQKELRLVREQQLKTIPKEDLFYEAEFWPYRHRYDELMLSKNNMEQRGLNDLFEASDVGYYYTFEQRMYFKDHGGEPYIDKQNRREFYKFHHRLQAMERTNGTTVEKPLEEYLSGNNKCLPFRVHWYDGAKVVQWFDGPKEGIEYFLPTAYEYSTPPVGRLLTPIIHIPRMSYLIHLFSNSYKERLIAVKPTGVEIQKLFAMFECVKVESYNLNALQNREDYFNKLRESLCDESLFWINFSDVLDKRIKTDRFFAEEVQKQKVR